MFSLLKKKKRVPVNLNLLGEALGANTKAERQGNEREREEEIEKEGRRRSEDGNERRLKRITSTNTSTDPSLCHRGLAKVCSGKQKGGIIVLGRRNRGQNGCLFGSRSLAENVSVVAASDQQGQQRVKRQNDIDVLVYTVSVLIL